MDCVGERKGCVGERKGCVGERKDLVVDEMKDFVVVEAKDDVVEKNDVVETNAVDETRYSAGAVDEANCFVDEANEFAVDSMRELRSDSDASYKMRGQTQTEAFLDSVPGTFHDSVLERCHRPSSSSGDRPLIGSTN